MGEMTGGCLFAQVGLRVNDISPVRGAEGPCRRPTEKRDPTQHRSPKRSLLSLPMVEEPLVAMGGATVAFYDNNYREMVCT